MQFSSIFTSALTLFSGTQAYNNLVCPKFPFLSVANSEYPMTSAIILSDVEKMVDLSNDKAKDIKQFVQKVHSTNKFSNVPYSWKAGIKDIKAEKVTDLIEIPGLNVQTALMRSLGIDCNDFKLVNEVVIRDVFAGRDFQFKYLFEAILLEFIFTNMLNVQCFDATRLDLDMPVAYRRGYDHEYALINYSPLDKYVNPDILESSETAGLIPTNLTRDHLKYRKISSLIPISILDNQQKITKSLKKQRLLTINSKGEEFAILQEIHAACKDRNLNRVKAFRDKRVKITGRVVRIDNKSFFHLNKIPVIAGTCSHANSRSEVILGGWPYGINTFPISKGTQRILTCVTKVGGGTLGMDDFQKSVQSLVTKFENHASIKTKELDFYHGFPVVYKSTNDLSPSIIANLNM